MTSIVKSLMGVCSLGMGASSFAIPTFINTNRAANTESSDTSEGGARSQSSEEKDSDYNESLGFDNLWMKISNCYKNNGEELKSQLQKILSSDNTSHNKSWQIESQDLKNCENHDQTNQEYCFLELKGQNNIYYKLKFDCNISNSTISAIKKENTSISSYCSSSWNGSQVNWEDFTTSKQTDKKDSWSKLCQSK